MGDVMTAHCRNEEPYWEDVLDEQIVGDAESDESFMDRAISFAMKVRIAPAGDLYEICMKEAQRQYRRENAVKRMVRRKAMAEAAMPKEPPTDDEIDRGLHGMNGEWTDQ